MGAGDRGGGTVEVAGAVRRLAGFAERRFVAG